MRMRVAITHDGCFLPVGCLPVQAGARVDSDVCALSWCAVHRAAWGYLAQQLGLLTIARCPGAERRSKRLDCLTQRVSHFVSLTLYFRCLSDSIHRYAFIVRSARHDLLRFLYIVSQHFTIFGFHSNPVLYRNHAL